MGSAATEGLGVVQIIQDAVPILVHTADAELVRSYGAAPLAYITAHSGTGQLFVEYCLTHFP